MGATFDPALPTKRDEARLWLGDYHTDATAGDVTDAFLQDATIDAMIGIYTFNEAVARLALALLSKYANEPSRYEERPGLMLEWQNRLASWQTVVKEARTAPPDPKTSYRPGIAIAQMTSPVVSNNPNLTITPIGLTKFRSN